MTITDLQKKTADVLGVSSTEKELAFEILISKVAVLLTENLTLRVPKIGFFQLREDNDENILIFSPLPEDFNRESKTLYLTIELPKTFQHKLENDTGVFSIGVGKPLLPLSDEVDKNIEMETSYAILKKSIEERVNEIISDSEHIPNFNIWEDYYTTLNKERAEEKDEIQLSELTDDIEFKEDMIAEEITNDLLNESVEESIETPTVNSEIPTEEISPTTLLEDYNPPLDEPEMIDSMKLEESLDQESEGQIDIENNYEQSEPEISIQEKLVTDDVLYKITKEYKPEEEIELPEIIDEEIDESDVDILGLKKQSDENIDWNWGDELKEEIELIRTKSGKTRFDFVDPDDETETEPPTKELFKSTKPLPTDYFTKLETTIKKEIEETEKDIQYMEYSGRPPKYEFVEDVPVPDYQPTVTQQQYFTNYRSTNDSSYEEYHKENDKHFGKSFLLLFSGFVVISSVIIYLLISGKNPNYDQIKPVSNAADSIVNYQNQEQPIDTSQIFDEEVSDFPRVATLPINDNDGSDLTQNSTSINEQTRTTPNVTVPPKTNQNNELYKTLQTDTRVGRTIYFDGNGFNVQVSSWRNRGKAEDEVKRLRGQGFNAFLVEANLPQKGGIWYRVRIGNFKSNEEAEQFLSKNNF